MMMMMVRAILNPYPSRPLSVLCCVRSMTFALHVNSARRGELRPTSSISLLTDQLNRSTLTDRPQLCSQQYARQCSAALSQDIFSTSPYTVSPESSQGTSEHEDEDHNTSWGRVVNKSNEVTAIEIGNFSVSAPPSNSFIRYRPHPHCTRYRTCRHFGRIDAPCSRSKPQGAGTTWSYTNNHQTTTSFSSTMHIGPGFNQSSHGCIDCASPCQAAPDNCPCTLDTSAYCVPAKRACRSVSAGMSVYGCPHSKQSCMHSSLKLKPFESHMNKLPRPVALRGGPSQDLADATLTRHTIHGLVALRSKRREHVLGSRYSWHYPSSLHSASTRHIPQAAGLEQRSTVHLQNAVNPLPGRLASRYRSFTFSSKHPYRAAANNVDTNSVSSFGTTSDSPATHSAGDTTQDQPSAFSPMHTQLTAVGLHTLFSHCSLSPDVDYISSSAQLPSTRTPSSGFHEASLVYWLESSSLPDCSKVGNRSSKFPFPRTVEPPSNLYPLNHSFAPFANTLHKNVESTVRCRSQPTAAFTQSDEGDSAVLSMESYIPSNEVSVPGLKRRRSQSGVVQNCCVCSFCPVSEPSSQTNFCACDQTLVVNDSTSSITHYPINSNNSPNRLMHSSGEHFGIAEQRSTSLTSLEEQGAIPILDSKRNLKVSNFSLSSSAKLNTFSLLWNENSNQSFSVPMVDVRVVDFPRSAESNDQAYCPTCSLTSLHTSAPINEAFMPDSNIEESRNSYTESQHPISMASQHVEISQAAVETSGSFTMLHSCVPLCDLSESDEEQELEEDEFDDDKDYATVIDGSDSGPTTRCRWIHSSQCSVTSPSSLHEVAFEPIRSCETDSDDGHSNNPFKMITHVSPTTVHFVSPPQFNPDDQCNVTSAAGQLFPLPFSCSDESDLGDDPDIALSPQLSYRRKSKLFSDPSNIDINPSLSSFTELDLELIENDS